MKNRILADFVKKHRKLNKLTQKELAKKAGVGLRLVRELEQGKTTLKVDNANKILKIFGATIAPVKLKDLRTNE